MRCQFIIKLCNESSFMKSKLDVVGIIYVLLLVTVPAQAQFRSHVPTPYSLMGPTIAVKSNIGDTGTFGLASLQMGHSYEMSFGSFGGQMYNQNMYTNTVTMQFNEKMFGRVDVAFAHSPFGSALPGMNQTGSIFIRNAEFNYAINDKTNISFHFSQNPNGMGYYNGGPFGGSGYSPYYNRNRFNPYNPY